MQDHATSIEVSVACIYFKKEKIMFAPRTVPFWGFIVLTALCIWTAYKIPTVLGGLITATFCGFPFILFQAVSVIGLGSVFDGSVVKDPLQALGMTLLGFLGFGPLMYYITNPWYRASVWSGETGMWSMILMTVMGIGLGVLSIIVSKKGYLSKN